MSTLATNAITDASGGNTATINSYTPTESNMAGRNRIINGDMRIDQRNAGASVAVTDNYTVDRWAAVRFGGAATMTAQQSTVAPAGFTNSLLFTIGTGATPDAASQTFTEQRIEGFNVADLGWGTSAAQAITVSFWVRSSVTGTYGLTARNSSSNRAYVASYTVNAANTLEYKTVTIPGDTAGTWATNNSTGLRIMWDLGSGSSYNQAAGSWTSGSFISGLTGGVKLAATSGATFYITGVQLEAGSVATPFEHVDYSEMLRRCQRYFWRKDGTTGGWAMATQRSTTESEIMIQFPVSLRANPTLGSSGTWNIGFWGSGTTVSSFLFNVTSNLVVDVQATHGSGGAAGRAVEVYASAGAYIDFNSEL